MAIMMEKKTKNRTQSSTAAPQRTSTGLSIDIHKNDETNANEEDSSTVATTPCSSPSYAAAGSNITAAHCSVHDVVACFRGVQLTEQQQAAIDEDAVEEHVDQGEMLLDLLKEQQDLFQGLLPLIQVAQQQDAIQHVTTAILHAEAMITTNQEQQRELRGETFSLSSGSSSSSSSSLEKTGCSSSTSKSAFPSSSSSTMVMERRGASVVQGTTTPNTATEAALNNVVPQHYGPWRFAETAVAGQRRQRVGTAMALTSMKSIDSVEYNEDDYGPRLEEALFGQLLTTKDGDSGGEELQGDSFGTFCRFDLFFAYGLFNNRIQEHVPIPNSNVSVLLYSFFISSTSDWNNHIIFII